MRPMIGILLSLWLVSPGSASRQAQRFALLEPTGVLEPGGHVHVPVDPVLPPGRKRPHRQQQRRVGGVTGPAQPFDVFTDRGSGSVTPRDLGGQASGVFEIVDFGGHVPSLRR